MNEPRYTPADPVRDGLSAPGGDAELPCCEPGDVPDCEPLSPRIADALEAAEAELRAAEIGAAEVIDDLFDSVSEVLGDRHGSVAHTMALDFSMSSDLPG